MKNINLHNPVCLDETLGGRATSEEEPYQALSTIVNSGDGFVIIDAPQHQATSSFTRLFEYICSRKQVR